MSSAQASLSETVVTDFSPEYKYNLLFFWIDDNVDVIYVSSIPITEETLQYYIKLFGLRQAVKSGKLGEQTDYSNRYKIVLPEALNSFPVYGSREHFILNKS